MPTNLESVVSKYLRSGNPAQRTREEYSTTLRKWTRWGGAVPLEQLGRKEIRDFLDWVHEDASVRQTRNPGRTSNKVRSHLRAVMSWAWEQDIVAAPSVTRVVTGCCVDGSRSSGARREPLSMLALQTISICFNPSWPS